MRIISKFRDYYDGAAGPGNGAGACYLRASRRVTRLDDELERHFLRTSLMFDHDPIETRAGSYVLAPFFVAFCGRLYRGVSVDFLSSPSRSGRPRRRGTERFYAWNKLATYLAQHQTSIPNERAQKGQLTFAKRVERHLSEQGTCEFQTHLVEKKIVALTVVESAERYGISPTGKIRRIWRAHAYHREVDPNLATIEFGGVFDAFSAYQEIDMYVSGTLVSPDRPMLELTESDRVAQHGFDHWSFRRPPNQIR